MIITWFNVLSANSVIDELYLTKLKSQLHNDGIRIIETEIIGNYLSLQFHSKKDEMAFVLKYGDGSTLLSDL